MINIRANGNKLAYGIKHFVLDDRQDLDKINVYELPAGCTAFIIHTSKKYMLDSNYKWYEIKPSVDTGDGSDDGGGGSGGDTSDDIVYEGGVI